MAQKSKRKNHKKMNDKAQKKRLSLGTFKQSKFSRPQLSVFILIFALIGGYFLYRSFAAQAPVASMEAEQMSLPAGGSVISDSTASGGNAVQLLTNGSATGFVSFPSSVTSLTVMAKGSQCSGAPTMTLIVDGNNIFTNTAVSSTSWAAYNGTPVSALAAGTHSLSIAFTNDYYNPGKVHGGKTHAACDRNLYIDVTNFYGPDVTVPVPTVSLSASPTSVTAGQSSTLTWTSSNATSCTASGSWSGSQPTSGSASTGALNQNSTYSLTCTGTGGSASASQVVTVTSSTSQFGPRTSSPSYLSLTGSFYNTALPSAVTINPSSSYWQQTLYNMYSYGIYNNYNDWSTTVYHANSSTPKVTVNMPVFNDHITIPYQSNWVPDRQSDGHIIVVDDSTGCGYEFQGFVQSTLTAHHVRVVHAYTGSGAHKPDAGISGGELSFLGYIITPKDINGGSINHALGYATGFNSPNYVTPGTRSDGTNTGGIPEGQLMRLDPSVNLSNFGLDAFQTMVAKALQKYGAYDVDSGGAFAISTEDSYDGSTYNIPINNDAIPHSLEPYIQFINFPFAAPVLDSNFMSDCSQPF
jgi:hypothetical protein